MKGENDSVKRCVDYEVKLEMLVYCNRRSVNCDMTVLCNVSVGGRVSRLPGSHRALLTGTTTVWKTNI